MRDTCDFQADHTLWVHKSVKGSTIPELLISMIITSILTYYCTVSLTDFYKDSVGIMKKSSENLRKINLLIQIHKDFANVNEIKLNRNQLLLKVNKYDTSGVRIVFQNDTIYRTFKNSTEYLSLENLHWNFKKRYYCSERLS